MGRLPEFRLGAHRDSTASPNTAPSASHFVPIPFVVTSHLRIHQSRPPGADLWRPPSVRRLHFFDIGSYRWQLAVPQDLRGKRLARDSQFSRPTSPHSIHLQLPIEWSRSNGPRHCRIGICVLCTKRIISLRGMNNSQAFSTHSSLPTKKD